MICIIYIYIVLIEISNKTCAFQLQQQNVASIEEPCKVPSVEVVQVQMMSTSEDDLEVERQPNLLEHSDDRQAVS